MNVRFQEYFVRAVLVHKSDDQPILLSIVDCLSGIDCLQHFSDHLGKHQTEQKKIVSRFQNLAKSELQLAIPEVKWSIEYRPSRTNRDSIDIFGQGREFVVAIELDKNRADQVAKKFVSRVALLPATTVYFVSLCYPGTERMNRSECEKYFGYCSTLALRMKNHYAGLVVE
jgi:hypothetical protein